MYEEQELPSYLPELIRVFDGKNYMILTRTESKEKADELAKKVKKIWKDSDIKIAKGKNIFWRDKYLIYIRDEKVKERFG